MRDTLGQRFPNSEQAYEDCHSFLTDNLMKIPRAERGESIFILLGLWVMASVTARRKIEDEDFIIEQIVEALQNETAGFWK